MEVEVLSAMKGAERLVCQAARGDYYTGYIGDTSYSELMETVDYDDSDREAALKRANDAGVPIKSIEDTPYELEARTRSFIRKQASRGHWGPWEHPQITFAIEGVSRVTMAQITRHRHLSFDIQSMRYVDFEDADVAVPESLTNPDHFSRETGEVSLSKGEQELYREIFEQNVENGVEAYQKMVDAGVPKEDARYILPLGTQVNITMSGNARTMLHVLNLRQRGNAQWEIRDLSEQITEKLEEWIPYTAEWWEEKGPVQISP